MQFYGMALVSTSCIAIGAATRFREQEDRMALLEKRLSAMEHHRGRVGRTPESSRPDEPQRASPGSRPAPRLRRGRPLRGLTPPVTHQRRQRGTRLPRPGWPRVPSRPLHRRRMRTPSGVASSAIRKATPPPLGVPGQAGKRHGLRQAHVRTVARAALRRGPGAFGTVAVPSPVGKWGQKRRTKVRKKLPRMDAAVAGYRSAGSPPCSSQSFSVTGRPERS